MRLCGITVEGNCSARAVRVQKLTPTSRQRMQNVSTLGSMRRTGLRLRALPRQSKLKRIVHENSRSRATTDPIIHTLTGHALRRQPSGFGRCLKSLPTTGARWTTLARRLRSTRLARFCRRYISFRARPSWCKTLARLPPSVPTGTAIVLILYAKPLWGLTTASN